jgi:hypothetical protein
MLCAVAGINNIVCALNVLLLVNYNSFVKGINFLPKNHDSSQNDLKTAKTTIAL